METATGQLKNKIEDANKTAIQRVLSSKPFLVDVRPAIEVLPGMKKRSIFHSGPPIEWNKMAGPQRGAIVATMIFEKWANDWDEAVKLIEEGEIEFSPNNDHDAVGMMAGIISPSMPVLVAKNETHGNINFARPAEKRAQFGAFDDTAVQSLEFWSTVLAPAIKKGIDQCKHETGKGIDLKSMVAKALYMGDELHERHTAGTALFSLTILPYLIKTLDKDRLLQVMNYFAGHDTFFLCLGMITSKTIMNSARDIPFCSMVTVMARNGVEFGIKVSGLGDQWFTGPAGMIKGILFPGYRPEDANPDIGDSAIQETAGVGAFALANSPAVLSLIGGTGEDAIRYTREMREITMTLNDTYLVPMLEFQGTATGIDIRKVVKTGVTPIIDTAMAHKNPGFGMIGVGLVRAPMEAFKKALQEFGRKYQ